jgi:plasmid stability protein
VGVKTLYLRNVPDDVTERLERLAAREGLSVSAFAVRELRRAARRADNPSLLADLPSFEVSVDEVVADIHEGRSDQ